MFVTVLCQALARVKGMILAGVPRVVSLCDIVTVNERIHGEHRENTQ